MEYFNTRMSNIDGHVEQIFNELWKMNHIFNNLELIDIYRTMFLKPLINECILY